MCDRDKDGGDVWQITSEPVHDLHLKTKKNKGKLTSNLITKHSVPHED